MSILCTAGLSVQEDASSVAPPEVYSIFTPSNGFHGGFSLSQLNWSNFLRQAPSKEETSPLFGEQNLAESFKIYPSCLNSAQEKNLVISQPWLSTLNELMPIETKKGLENMLQLWAAAYTSVI